MSAADASPPAGPPDGPASGRAGRPGGALRGGLDFAAFVRGRPLFLSGFAILGVVVALAAAAPAIAPHSPVDADAGAYLLPPSLAHPMGTDTAGLDVFSRVLHAPRVDLPIAVASTLIGALVGGLVGSFAGLWQGRGGLKGVAAALALRAADVVQAFPVFALALVLVAVLGQGVGSIVLAIAIVGVPAYLRLMRGQALVVCAQPYVEAAVISGAGDLYLLSRHVVPNALPPILAQMVVAVGQAVLLTAGLSFIGAGVRAPTPEWGSMIAMGFQNMVTGQWWPSLFPGLALAITVFAFSAVGASIEAYWNPRERTRPTRRDWRAFLAARAEAG